MRLRLAHQLTLLMLATVVVAVTAMGAVVAWNLRLGFGDYLRSQEQDRLERFGDAVAAAVERNGPAVLYGGPETIRPLLEAALGGGPFGDERPGPPRDDDHGPRRGRVPRDPGGFVPRLSLVDAQGRRLWGRPPPAPAPILRQEIRVGGQLVAVAQLVELPAVPEGLDDSFLTRQYLGIAAVAAALALLAWAAASRLARRWARPLADAQQATRRIAQGAFDARVPVRRHDELGDLIDDVNAMAASLGELESSRRRWIAQLSHELRTPLTVLRLELDALADGVRPLQPSALDSLQDEVARLARLTDDFHELAMADLQALPCSFGDVDAEALLAATVRRHAARAAERGLALERAAGPALPLVRWDGDRIAQLLDNLVENAIRFTDAPGRIVLAARALDASRIELRIDDTAPGVPEADRPRLFEPLFRADPSRSRQSGGSGLGLAICRAIVLSHGGTLRAGDSPLGGLAVVAELPRNAEPASTTPNRRSAP